MIDDVIERLAPDIGELTIFSLSRDVRAERRERISGLGGRGGGEVPTTRGEPSTSDVEVKNSGAAVISGRIMGDPRRGGGREGGSCIVRVLADSQTRTMARAQVNDQSRGEGGSEISTLGAESSRHSHDEELPSSHRRPTRGARASSPRGTTGLFER